MTPARIVHQSPGRVRIEIAGRRGDAAYFAQLAEGVSRGAGVLRARGNALAASLVVEYTGALGSILSEIQGSDLDLAIVPDAPAEAVATPPLPWSRWTGGARVNPMHLAGAAFGVVGIVQTLRGEILLPALSAFWYASNAWRLAQTPSPDGAGTNTAGKQG